MQRRRGRLPLLCVLIGVAVVSTFAGVVYPFEAVAFSSLLALRRERRFLASAIAISVAMGVPIAIDLMLMWGGRGVHVVRHHRLAAAARARSVGDAVVRGGTEGLM